MHSWLKLSKPLQSLCISWSKQRFVNLEENMTYYCLRLILRNIAKWSHIISWRGGGRFTLVDEISSFSIIVLRKIRFQMMWKLDICRTRQFRTGTKTSFCQSSSVMHWFGCVLSHIIQLQSGPGLWTLSPLTDCWSLKVVILFTVTQLKHKTLLYCSLNFLLDVISKMSADEK